MDIDLGDNFVAKLEEGLTESDVALLVWSPDAAKSNWTKEEWTSVLARQVAEQKIRLSIVLLLDHPVPQLLRTNNYIDARTDQRAALRQTVEWVKRRESAQRLSGLKAPVYLPDYRPQDFVGREEYLVRLQGTLTAEPASLLLHGEPGTGKSTLALRFAWDAQKDFDAVIFQSCGQRGVDEIAAELSDRLPIDVKTLPPEKKRKQSMQWLRERQSLLVLDDVWNRDVRQLAPGPSCSVLYTSRQASLPWISAQQSIEVESFSEQEAGQLFHTFLDPVFGEGEVTRQRAVLLGFARKVEMLPIAVAVGASLLRERSASPLDRSALRLPLKDLNDGVRDVPQLFQRAIAVQPQREWKLLAAAAVCVQEGFWLPLVAQIAEAKAAGITEDEAIEAADRLVNSSLLRVLDRDRRRFQLHALLREQVRTTCGAAELDSLQQSHAASLETLFKDWETRWRDCRECLPEIVPAVSFLWERKERVRQSRLTLNGFAVARRIGELDEALRISKQEESLYVSNTGPEAPAVLQRSYGNQALILRTWGRLEEALTLHNKEEAICLELGIKDSLQISYGNQANILFLRGRLEEAMALYKEKEVICLELGNKEGLQASYGNQAVILQDWGRLEEALALLKKAEAICLEFGNKDGLQRSYGNQAVILKDWGRLGEALALHKKEEAICLELGNKDGLQASYGNQALILKDWGRLEEALALLKRAEAICLELGKKDGLQASYGNQALILQDCLEEALALHKKQEAICLELGNKSGLGLCYWQWASLAARQGNKQAERQKLEQALDLFSELRMPRERDAVRAELDKTDAA